MILRTATYTDIYEKKKRYLLYSMYSSLKVEEKFIQYRYRNAPLCNIFVRAADNFVHIPWTDFALNIGVIID